MNRAAGDALSLYLTGICGLAFLLGLWPLVNLLFSVIGLMLVIAAILGGIFLIIIRLRQGRSVAIASLELAIIGPFAFLMVYGTLWYFITYVPSQGTAMFNFPLVGTTPVPK